MPTETQSIPTPEVFTTAILADRSEERQKISEVEALISAHQDTVQPIHKILNLLSASAILASVTNKFPLGTVRCDVPETLIHDRGGRAVNTALPPYPVQEPDENGVVLAAAVTTGYRDFRKNTLELHPLAKGAPVPVTWLFAGFVASNGLQTQKSYDFKPVLRVEEYTRGTDLVSQRVPDEMAGLRYGSERRQFKIFDRPDLGIAGMDWVDLAQQEVSERSVKTIEHIGDLLVRPLYENIRPTVRLGYGYRTATNLLYPQDSNRTFNPWSEVDRILNAPVPVGDIVIQV